LGKINSCCMALVVQEITKYILMEFGKSLRMLVQIENTIL
jgi:hypothetical protein